MDSINVRIKILIEKLGISQKAFAESLNTSPSRISNIIKERNKPDSDILEKILRKFTNVNPSWLMLGEGDIFFSNKIPFNENKENGSFGNTGIISTETYLIHRKILRKYKELQEFYDAWDLFDENNSEIKKFIIHYIEKTHNPVWDEITSASINGEVNDDFIDKIAKKLNNLTKYTDALWRAGDILIETIMDLKQYDKDEVFFDYDKNFDELDKKKNE